VNKKFSGYYITKFDVDIQQKKESVYLKEPLSSPGITLRGYHEVEKILKISFFWSPCPFILFFQDYPKLASTKKHHYQNFLHLTSTF
jgi:hypothetical protein